MDQSLGLKTSDPWMVKLAGYSSIEFSGGNYSGANLRCARSNESLAKLFVGLLSLALIIGFLYGKGGNKRAWCRHVCPIGSLLGVFSRLGMIDFVAKIKQLGQDKYTQQGACPMMISIKHKKNLDIVSNVLDV